MREDASTPATAAAGMIAVEAEADGAVEAGDDEDDDEENDDGAEHDLAVEGVVGGFLIVIHGQNLGFGEGGDRGGNGEGFREGMG